MGQSAVKTQIAPENLPDCLGDQFRRALLQQHTFRPVPQRRFVKIQALVSGKHDHPCVMMTIGDAMQLLREIIRVHLAPQKDDFGLL